MSKPNGKRRNLDQIVAQRSDALGGAEVEFDFGGETFSMPHPLLADDDWKMAMRDAGEDEIAIARNALGDENYDRFRRVGGRAGYITLLVQEVMSEVQGMTPDADPTQSSTSSATTPKQSKRT